MHRFLENLGSGAGGSADGRLSPRDAMERFRERIEQHAQETQEVRERQERYQVEKAATIDEIWTQALKDTQNERSLGGSEKEKE